MSPPSKRIGDWGEQYAVNYLRWRGYTVKERNYRAGHHEIDIIASRFGLLVFVEVKARSYLPSEVDALPPPGTAVKRDKQRFTRQAAREYLFTHPTKKKPRMDVIEVWLQKQESPDKKPKLLRIHHIPGAY